MANETSISDNELQQNDIVPETSNIKFKRIVYDWLWNNGHHQGGWQYSQIDDIARMLEYFESIHVARHKA